MCRYVEPAAELPEIALLGGDVTAGVVRVGDTVRRPRSSHSSAVHAYLRHLECAGFDGAPRFLGIDSRGREVLTFVQGEMAGRPLRGWASGAEVLAAVARLQRRLHDCSDRFVLPAGASWDEPVRLDGVDPPYDVPDIIGDNDMTPENIIFANQLPVGIVDFDLAGPTTRVLDIATTLLWWAPLRDPADRDPLLRDADAGRRMRLFVDAYGLCDESKGRLLDVVQRRFARSWQVMRYRAEHQGGGWARMWDDGVGDVIRRSQSWFGRERDTLEVALFG